MRQLGFSDLGRVPGNVDQDQRAGDTHILRDGPGGVSSARLAHSEPRRLSAGGWTGTRSFPTTTFTPCTRSLHTPWAFHGAVRGCTASAASDARQHSSYAPA